MKSDPLAPGPLILVVDDETMVRNYISYALELEGYRVYQACNGQEAMQVLTKYGNQINLLITDMDMPVMDGYELIQAIKEQNFGVKILTISGRDSDRLKKLAEKNMPHLDKPFKPISLLEKVSKLLPLEN